MKYIGALLLTLAFLPVVAQTVINEEVGVRALMDKFESIGKSQENIEGWRIKIINTTDRRAMESARFKFNQLYPQKDSKSSYENPYYSILTGAYAKRIDLEAFLVELKRHFRNAIPVRDKIAKEEIVRAMTNG